MVVNHITINYESPCTTVISFYFEKLVEIDINQISPMYNASRPGWFTCINLSKIWKEFQICIRIPSWLTYRRPRQTGWPAAAGGGRTRARQRRRATVARQRDGVMLGPRQGVAGEEPLDGPHRQLAAACASTKCSTLCPAHKGPHHTFTLPFPLN